VRFELDDAQRQAFAAGPAVLAVDHPAYSYEQDLSPETRASLVSDWDGG
jgi:hypothetical protein